MAARHPTLGSCHAWLQASTQPAPELILQECAVGLVPIRRTGNQLAFAAPPLQRSAVAPAVLAQVAAALGLNTQHILAAQMLDNGPAWLGLLLDDADVLLQLNPNHLQLKHLGLKVGVAHMNQSQSDTVLIARSNREARAFGGHASPTRPQPEPAQAQVRAFAAPVGVNEDPVTGSLNASLAQWLMAEGLAPTHYVATQGTCLGRHGQVHLHQDDASQVWVGGSSVTCVDGTVSL